MIKQYRIPIQLWMIVATVGLVTSPAHPVPGNAEVVREVHARGIANCILFLPEVTKVASVSLQLSDDGEHYEESRTGFPRPWQLAYSDEYDRGTAIVTIPLVGQFSGGPRQFLFEQPGTYYLRWSISQRGGGSAIRIDQTIEVGEPQRQDVEFLEKISSPDILQQLFDRDVLEWLNNEDADSRALHVIRKLLEATRLVEPLEGGGWGRYKSKKAFLKSMDTMFELAEEFSESSYAPYAAFYAGGGYITHMCHENDILGDLPNNLQSHALSKKIEEALNYTVEQGDSYLRPRAIFQQARIRLVMGAWEEAEEKLKAMEKTAGAEGTLHALANEARKDIVRLKKRGQKDRGLSEQDK